MDELKINELQVRNDQLVPKKTDLKQSLFVVEDKTEFYEKMHEVNKAIFRQRTPREAIFKREGAKGKIFEYLIDDYFRRVLNHITPMSDFIVISQTLQTFEGKDEAGNIVKTYAVLGVYRLVLNFSNGLQRIADDTSTFVVKMTSYGEPMIDTAWKGAKTDGFKRCCASLGIASDIYGRAEKNEYHELVFEFFFDKVFANAESAAAKDTRKEFINKIYAKDVEQTILNMVSLLASKPEQFKFVKQENLTQAFKNKQFHELLDFVLQRLEEHEQSLDSSMRV